MLPVNPPEVCLHYFREYLDILGTAPEGFEFFV
jgi:hypothetical protein